jgi:uncharacterized damage-inducible protein DinB
MTDAIDPRYPIGRFEPPAAVDAATRTGFIEAIEALPGRMRAAVAGLDDARLDTAYRDGGWSVRQVVHHVADSHLNAYVRLKLALTEDQPLVKEYDETRWAELPEARSGPVDLSLNLIDALHRRWAACLRALPADAFDRTFRHPSMGVVPLNALLALYAWHGRHHVAQISALRERLGW